MIKKALSGEPIPVYGSGLQIRDWIHVSDFCRAITLILEKGIHPGELKDMVTSPGGTTIEGCEALEKAGMRGAVIECINVSTEKSRSL